ncbi:RTA1-domain-containing protein [Zopfia rhizophila CBS 207.26]|uniref:RTA1-domain-containing protein n=1 Tax=Zopfia rhizophila CBS 207.26 TaxID=1314779 RepID=A0A6A6DI48_9PEZI|nr:RTA1-domain-containing protein [Zopfia rhizophila CBS 207.26]
MAAAVIFIILFILITAIHLYQLIRTRLWIFIPFILGGFLQWIGYIGRAISVSETPNWTIGPYVMQTLLLLVAPAVYAASIYIMLGPIIILTNGEIHSIVQLRWLTKIFVAGDVLSFLLQGADHIGGLMVQLLFSGFFMVTSAVFHICMTKFPTTKVLSVFVPWERQLYALYIASALSFVRSLFRLIEYAQGNDGYLISHEVYLYIFDAVLMFATMAVFAWIHPSEITARLSGGNGKHPAGVFRAYGATYPLPPPDKWGSVLSGEE